MVSVYMMFQLIPHIRIACATITRFDFAEHCIACRADRSAVLNTGIGKIDFSVEALEENALALVSAVLAARPKVLKGTNAKCALCLTLTPHQRAALVLCICCLLCEIACSK